MSTSNSLTHPFSISPLTMLLAAVARGLVAKGEKKLSISSTVSSSTPSSLFVRATVGRVMARFFARRGRSIHMCWSLGATLARVGRSMAAAAGLVTVSFRAALGDTLETTDSSNAHQLSALFTHYAESERNVHTIMQNQLHNIEEMILYKEYDELRLIHSN